MANKRERSERREVSRMAANILAVYLGATDLQRAAGREWYAEEHARVVDFAARHGLTVDAAAGAASAISPGMRWEFVFSHLAALRANEKHKVPTYSRVFVDKALACMRGRAPAEVLTGPKTRAFYELLARPDTPGYVVVDGHALNIARGVPAPIRGAVPAAGRVTAARYRRAAAAYREVAALVGETAHSVQACTWLFWREALNIATRGGAA